jgi:hypothetical protein
LGFFLAAGFFFFFGSFGFFGIFFITSLSSFRPALIASDACRITVRAPSTMRFHNR